MFPAEVGTRVEGSVEEGMESRAPASVSGEPLIQEIYRRNPKDKHSKTLEKAFRKRVLRGTPKGAQKSAKVSDLETLELKLAKRAEREQANQRKQLLEELGRIPASQ